LYLRNNELMITKKEKRKKKDQEIGHASRKLPPPPYMSHTHSTLPRFASGTSPLPTSPSSFALIADSYQIPPGNPAPSRSATPVTDYPLAFMAEQLAQARSALRLNPLDLPAFRAETLANTIPAESTTVALQSQLVKGLVTFSHELSGVSQKLQPSPRKMRPLGRNSTTSPRSWPTSPPLKTKAPPKCWLTSRHLFATCQILCRPQSQSPRKRRPPPIRPTRLSPPQAPTPLGRVRKGPEHHTDQPPLWLRTLNTSYHSTTQSLARLSATPRSTLGCCRTAARLVNTGGVHMTCPPSPPATFTLRTTPPPPMLK